MNPQPSPPFPPYKPRPSALWWLQNWKYFLFMMRELSAVFIALFLLMYLVGIYRLCQGESSYQAHLETLQTPFVKALLVVIALFSIYHTVTWLHLMPTIMVVRVGQKVVRPVLLLIANYLVWALISGLLLYLWIMI